MPHDIAAETRITGETVAPCLVSLGGRVRLYEGRFQAIAT